MVLPSVETGTLRACLEALVSVEGDFSVRKQTNDALFVGCSCCCYFFGVFRPILCQMYKVKKKPQANNQSQQLFFQFHENA